MAKNDRKKKEFNPLGGLLDFNRDGKTDLFELYLARDLYNSCINKNESTSSYTRSSKRYDWRDDCEDGSEYDIDPYDYEYKSDYLEAIEYAEEQEDEELDEAIEWNDDYNVLDEKDYENKRKYNAALQLWIIDQYHRLHIYNEEIDLNFERCEFIVNNSDILASNYLTHDGYFLYGQALKEHFNVPIAINDEDEYVANDINDIIVNIADIGAILAVDIWIWCIENFLPYTKYENTQNYIIECMDYRLSSRPELFIDTLLDRLSNNDNLINIFMSPYDNVEYIYLDILCYSLTKNKISLTKKMLQAYLHLHKDMLDKICHIVSELINHCSNFDELETMECFKKELFPLINEIDNSKIKDLIKLWTKEINEYIEYMETTHEKYAYTRRNVWRVNYIDGTEYGVDPLDYESNEDYMEALYDAGYGWRERCALDAKTYNIDLLTCDNEDEFWALYNKKRDLSIQRKQAIRIRKEQEANRLNKMAAINDGNDSDTTVYTFYGVNFEKDGRTYHYRSIDNLSIGDKVIVPVGKENEDAIARVVSVEHHLCGNAPYPVDKMKFIKKILMKFKD